MTEMTDGIDAGFSLADLAEIDVTDIAEVRYASIPMGVYDFLITKAELAEDEKDGERRFKAEIEMKIAEVHAVLEPNVDKESLIDKLHTERFFIKPNEEQAKVLASIGRIRAFVADVGMDNTGKLGDIVSNLKDHAFKASIVNAKNKDDPSNPFKRLKLEQKRS